MSNKLLIIEDEILLAQSLEDLLEEESYEVDIVHNGEEALSKTFEKKYDLYLIDINIPLIDGLTLLEELREAGDLTPAIFLTSHKEKLKEGFLSGGDDYITKPFDNEELLLRIQALLRRTAPKECIIKDFIIYDTNMEIHYKNTPLELSKKEYELLKLFLLHANTTIPKEQLLQTLWEDGEKGSDGALRVYINRLKNIIEELHIENIRGIGYKLVL